MHELPPLQTPQPDDAAWWRLRADWLYRALITGVLPDHDGMVEKRRLPLVVNNLGRLSFQEGDLVVADPYLMGADPRPIEQPLLKSAYEVGIARATVGPEHDRNAAALLTLGDVPVVEWDMARWSGQDLASLGREEFFGYGVDAGTGCFADLAAAKTAGRILAEDAGMLDDPLSRALFLDPKAPGAAVVTPEDGASPVAVFTSGWGDGMYPTWLGLSERGEVVVALTDFLLTGDPYALPPEPPKQRTAPVTAPAESPRPAASRWPKLFSRRR